MGMGSDDCHMGLIGLKTSSHVEYLSYSMKKSVLQKHKFIMFKIILLKK